MLPWLNWSGENEPLVPVWSLGERLEPGQTLGRPTRLNPPRAEIALFLLRSPRCRKSMSWVLPQQC